MRHHSICLSVFSGQLPKSRDLGFMPELCKQRSPPCASVGTSFLQAGSGDTGCCLPCTSDEGGEQNNGVLCEELGEVSPVLTSGI